MIWKEGYYKIPQKSVRESHTFKIKNGDCYSFQMIMEGLLLLILCKQYA